MINKVELGSVNIKNITPKYYVSDPKTVQPSFGGSGNYAFKKIANKMGDLSLKGIQKCEESPMINVAVLDLLTAILPRTFFETFIGSKQVDENGNVSSERKLNVMGGFEALRREGSGLLINCMIPGAIVVGAAKLLNKPVMGEFKLSNLTGSWANGDSISHVAKYYEAAQGVSQEDRVFNALKTMFNDLEGVDGDIDNGGLKKFKDIFANDAKFDENVRNMAKNIVSDKPKAGYSSEMYKYLVGKSGISENIRFSGDNKFSTSSLGHLCDSAGEVLHGAFKEGLLTEKGQNVDFGKYLSKAKKLVNWKSAAGLGIIIPLAIAAQPINRWITHKMSGKKGAPIYNDDQERILSSDEKKKLTAQKFIAVPLMWGVAGLSMLMDRPSLKMFQFKNIFPTMDQARIISAATFSSRLAAAEDSNELQENTIRDIATFSSFYFLGDYAAKAIATFLEKTNKDGIKLINKLKTPDKNANALQKFWNWAKHTKMKSTDELGAIADEAMRTKAKNLRALCQIGNLAFSLISLGVFIPLYTRTQTNKKKQMQEQMAATGTQTSLGSGTTAFSQNLIKTSSTTFKSFFG